MLHINRTSHLPPKPGCGARKFEIKLLSPEHGRQSSDVKKREEIGHHAPVRTRAKQEQAQGAAPGQLQNRTAGGATRSGRPTMVVQAGRRKFANMYADRGSGVHAADDTPSKNE